MKRLTLFLVLGAVHGLFDRSLSLKNHESDNENDDCSCTSSQVVCPNQVCIDACGGVVCAQGQVCKNDACIAPDDPCEACTDSQVCQGSVCLETCNDQVVCPVGHVCFQDDCHPTFMQGFSDLQFVWPTPQSVAGQMSATFGPRLQQSQDARYDFHRGIDIAGKKGDPIVASFTGTVVSLPETASGGSTVVLEHDFGQPVVFHNQLVEHFYTHYFHLKARVANLEIGSILATNITLGTMGDTGTTTFVHLHHEVRVATRCSLAFAVSNPISSCNTLGIDPHVHPYLVYPNSYIASGATLSLYQMSGKDKDLIFQVQTSEQAANVNRYEIQTDSQHHVLDLNMRTGYDATSLETLDAPDTSVPYLDPQGFTLASTEWIMHVVVPQAWMIEEGPVQLQVWSTFDELLGTIST